MGSSLLELPDECICIVLSFLRPSQVRRVALTFNHRLFAATKPFLEPLAKLRRDEAHFESLFGKIGLKSNCNQVFREDYLKRLGFTDFPISVPSRLSRHLEYLDLKGDLSWLEDIVNEDHDPVESIYFDGDGLEELLETIACLGLTLPPAFVKLLKSEKLRDRVPSYSGRWIEFLPLLKVRNQLGQDTTQFEEGYIFTWFWDQQSIDEKHMYFDTAGRHAILGSGKRLYSREGSKGVKEELLDLTDTEKQYGVQTVQSNSVGELSLEDVDFESWLVNTYYMERCCFLEIHERADTTESFQLPDHVKKHFYNVYTEEGRNMQ